MDNMYDVRSIEFLDFDGVDEKEQIRVRTSLQQNDPSVQLPWIKADKKISAEDKIVKADPAPLPPHPTAASTSDQLPNAIISNAAASTHTHPPSYPEFKPSTPAHQQQQPAAVLSPPPAIINNNLYINQEQFGGVAQSVTPAIPPPHHHHHHHHMVPVYYSQALSPMSPPYPQAVFIPGPAEVPILQVAATVPPAPMHPYHPPPQSTATYATQPYPPHHHHQVPPNTNFHNGISPTTVIAKVSSGPSKQHYHHNHQSSTATSRTTPLANAVPEPTQQTSAAASGGAPPPSHNSGVVAKTEQSQDDNIVVAQSALAAPVENGITSPVSAVPTSAAAVSTPSAAVPTPSVAVPTPSPAVPTSAAAVPTSATAVPPPAAAVPPSVAAATTPAPPAANKSWASLFSSKANGVVSQQSASVGASAGAIINTAGAKKDADTNNYCTTPKTSLIQDSANKCKVTVTAESNANNNNVPLCPIKNAKKMQMQFIDPDCYRMGEFLMSHQVDGRTISLQPRGLLNQSNYCYVNSILQALIACPPFYNLLNGLSQNISSNEKRKPTPVIDGMCRFVKEFNHLPANLRVNNRRSEGGKPVKKDQGVLINTDIPFEPSWIYRVLNGIKSDLIEGRQEDAEEFLGCLLNGLNDEMLELIRLVKNDEDEPELIGTNINNNNNSDADNWQVMGPKNKGSFTRRTDFGRTPISDIFGGFLKSRILRAGDHISENIQPFFTLQLNIEKVNTVREALEALVMKNQLEGLTSSKTNEEVEAWQQVILDGLPVILILHLKCFDYKMDGCTKIVKALEFPVDLKIDSKLLSSKTLAPKERQYKLFAVVYHDGKEASKGHYVTDAFHVGYSSWLRYDDATVKPVLEEHVLKPQGTRVPYLLFYRRSDTIRSNK